MDALLVELLFTPGESKIIVDKRGASSKVRSGRFSACWMVLIREVLRSE
jgi:hypothetical protein